MIFDTTTMPGTLARREAIEEDEVVRRNLQVARRHIQAELDADLDAILDTLVADPIYHMYNFVNGAGVIDSFTVRGREAVRALYTPGCEDGTIRLQELRGGRVVADRHMVAVEGELRAAWSGKALVAAGYAADARANYLLMGRMCSFVQFSADGLMLGESVYLDPTGFGEILNRKI